MKTKIAPLIISLMITLSNLNAQDVTTVTAVSSDISDNLDLEAVASLFGDAKNLEDFERQLNDPELQISNLDLNDDGFVDYLRVIETSSGETHLVTIQAVIGENMYQDVATIDVERDSDGNTQVRVVGDVYMYGPDYIIVPVYIQRPVIFVWFWGSYYRPWYSPYYYGYYPHYFHHRHPYPVYKYRRNVVVHKNVNNAYRRTIVKRSSAAVTLQNQTRRSDYESKYPKQSFEQRNKGVKNKQELTNKRQSVTGNNSEKTTVRQTKSEKSKSENQTQSKTKIRSNTNERSKPAQTKLKTTERSNSNTTKKKRNVTSKR